VKNEKMLYHQSNLQCGRGVGGVLKSLVYKVCPDFGQSQEKKLELKNVKQSATNAGLEVATDALEGEAGGSKSNLATAKRVIGNTIQANGGGKKKKRARSASSSRKQPPSKRNNYSVPVVKREKEKKRDIFDEVFDDSN
jgi:hypothetical protein